MNVYWVKYTVWDNRRGRVVDTAHLTGTSATEAFTNGKREGVVPRLAVLTEYMAEDPDPAMWRVTW